MDVAASSNVANIYAGVHEEKILLSPGNIRTILCSTVIIFMIIYADDNDDCLEFCKRTIKIGNLELTWEISEMTMSFLNMLIYIELTDKSLQWKPFCKSRNNLEQIPFTSHHLFDIKQGIYYGEITHMAILSSNPANYIDTIKDLSSIYIA